MSLIQGRPTYPFKMLALATIVLSRIAVSGGVAGEPKIEDGRVLFLQ